jgi:hypothetical protein
MVFSFSQARAAARPCLIQSLACDSHEGNESLLLSARCSGSGLSCNRSIVLLPLGGDGNGGDLLLINGEVGGATRYGRRDGGG